MNTLLTSKITKIPLNTQNDPNTPILPKLPIYPWTSNITKIPLECPKLPKKH